MNAWLSDASSIPNHDNGAFNATIDPSMAFLQPSPSPQDPNQFQRMYNGVPRNVSPGFHNPNQVIPSKRPRPEDGMSMSPRQAPGGLPVSRSQTPHQAPFPGFQGPANGTPQYAHHPAPYQHLQQGGSVNPTQSPVVQDFDQHGVQRMQTASPSPFSTAGPPVGSQISASPSDQGTRVNTPQNSSFMPGQPFPQCMAPQFSPSPAMSSAATPASMQANFNNMPQAYSSQAMAAQQQRLYQMQLQNQARQMQANNPGMAGRPAGGAMNPMANPQMAALRQMQQNMAQQYMTKPGNPEAFMRSLQKFMMSRNLPLDTNPIVCGRPINLVQLYATVIKLGGSKKVSAANMWPAIAQQLQFPPMQFPTAAQEIRDHYQRNLAAYEQAFLNSQKQLAEQLQQNASQRQPGDMSGMFQQSPVKPGPSFDQHSQQFTSSPQAGAPMQNNAQQNATNGFMTPQQARPQSKQQQTPQQQPPAPPQPQQNQHRPSISRQSQPPVSAPDPSVSAQTAPSVQPGKSSVSTPGKASVGPEQPSNQSLSHHIEDPFKPMVLPESNRHGPIVVDEVYQLGEDISRLKPNVPTFHELGVVDIHALTMSIKSGLHAEMRMALDTLMTVSAEPTLQVSLENCDDLVDTLVECAEDQLELLAENAAEVSDVMLLPSYEEVLRACRLELSSLVDIPEFGSLDYELDRAVERLLCITSIIRNFSFSESNFAILATPTVVKLFSTIIRYLGTRNMLLRTNRNILDFMKDTVTYLSNIAHTVHLPGREEALCLLHFLLSFAPLPAPSLSLDGVMFSPYNPTLHKYTPTAVDSLAKLLARDEPNRMYYKAIFASEGELLTRAFGLAICGVPDQPRKQLGLADVRKVFLMQGLLAAEILTSLTDGAMARAWLESADGFAVHLLRLCCILSTDRGSPANHRQSQAARGQADEALAYSSIINRGLSILRRLAEKSKQEDGTSRSRFPPGVLPKRESLLGALLTPNLDPGVVKQLIAYAGLGD